MAYDREHHKEVMRKRRAKEADIGELPPVRNRRRKSRCRKSFKKFCETYKKEAFSLKWSDDHLQAIKIIEDVVLNGGLFVLSMPRGSGKTSLAVAACEWALLYGHRRYVCLVAATGGKAEALLKSIKNDLRFCQNIVDDFPEVCYPIRKLEGRSNRAAGQTVNGQPTNIAWLNDKIVFPSVAGSNIAGSIVTVAGITGDIRGQQHTTDTGEIIRPDLVLPDDPQTRESAASEAQTNARIATIQGDILGLAGPGISIAGIMPCTVIKSYDLADRMLSDEFPDWKPIRTQMLYGEPANPQLWDQYATIRDEALKNDLGKKSYNDFYKANRKEMDEGLTASWEQRKTKDDISAIQHAYNLKLRDEEAFQAEYQNLPLDDDTGVLLEERQIIEHQHGVGAGVVPADAEKVVAFVDVQKEALYWTLCSFKQDFSGALIDYGIWPEQPDISLYYKNLRKTLSKTYPGQSFEYRLKAGLSDLAEHLLDRTWDTEDQIALDVDLMLVDANWGQSRDTIYNWIRRGKFRNRVLPSHGKYVGASSEPLNAGQAKRIGKFIGTHWRIDRSKELPQRYVLYDTNYWKSFFHERLSTARGIRGDFTLYESNPRVHQAIARHIRSEYPITTQGRGRTVDEWRLKPGVDNHWLDCLVGCMVAASIHGCSIASAEATGKAPVQRKPREKRIRKSRDL